MPIKKKKGDQQPKKIIKKITIPVRDNVPLDIFYPEEKRKMKNESKYLDTDLATEYKNQIIQQFPQVQNKISDLFYAEKAFLKINNGKKFEGAVALTLHFVGFFKFNPGFSYSKIKCVHIYDIYSIRIKQWNKTLLYCRIENNQNQNDDVLNVHVNSPHAIAFTQILERNYMLSTVAYDSYETCDFRTYDSSLFPSFDNGLSPSQGYQLTYFCFCSRLGLPYNHEFTRFYHEHICNFDGFFDFSLIFDSRNLKPAIYAMMFVPYVMAIICHKVKIENISQSIELIIKRSNFLRALHLSGCDIDQDGIRRMGAALVENLKIYKERISSRDPKYADYQQKYPTPIPVQYWNFENNTLVDAKSFFQGLKDPAFTADVFYLSFSNCQIQDITGLFSAISTNEHLHQIKYLYFNGNQKVGPDEMEVFIKHLNKLADYVNKPDRKRNKLRKCLYERIGVSGKGKALERLFQTLIDREYPIKELSLAGSTIDRKADKQFYTPSRGANAIINYFNHANELEVIDLSSIDCDKQDLSLILQGMNRSQMLNRIHVKLNNIKKEERDYEPLLAAAKAFLYTKMDKWESLEFADNYLNSFELDFLLSLFLKMKNLKMLNLSNNFHKDDPTIDNVLYRLHELHLTKLYLAGSFDTGRYLPTQTFGLLDKLIEQGILEELDISGNLMRDKCYKYVIEILNKCPNLHTLIIDQNKPKSFQLFDDVIRLVMKKKNLTFFPFPSIDLMYIFHHCSGIRGLDEEQLSQFRWYLINLRYECIDKINSHRERIGLPPQLPFKSVPELGEMVNDVHDEMMRLLQNIRFYIHGGVASDINVPLPYLHEFQEYINGPNVTEFKPDYDPKEIIDKYHVEHIFKRINESQVNKFNVNDFDTIRKKLDKPFQQSDDETPSDGGGNNSSENSNNSSDNGGNTNSSDNGGNTNSSDNSGNTNNGNSISENTNSDARRPHTNRDGNNERDRTANSTNPRGKNNNNKRTERKEDYSDGQNSYYEDNNNNYEYSNNYEDGDENDNNYDDDDEYEVQKRSHKKHHHHRHHHHKSHHRKHKRDEYDDYDNDDGYDDENQDANDFKKSSSKKGGHLRSPGSPESPKKPNRIPIESDDDYGDGDDDDDDDDNDDEYNDSNSDSGDPAYGLKARKVTKPRNKKEVSGYDDTDDNSKLVRKYTGTSKDPISSSAIDNTPPPFTGLKKRK